jgi:hypothetical protein
MYCNLNVLENNISLVPYSLEFQFDRSFEDCAEHFLRVSPQEVEAPGSHYVAVCDKSNSNNVMAALDDDF